MREDPVPAARTMQHLVRPEGAEIDFPLDVLCVRVSTRRPSNLRVAVPLTAAVCLNLVERVVEIHPLADPAVPGQSITRYRRRSERHEVVDLVIQAEIDRGDPDVSRVTVHV